jgi:glucose/arabinose dehydrogenase/ABC-type amino acid transport substrate-binding protein
MVMVRIRQALRFVLSTGLAPCVLFGALGTASAQPPTEPPGQPRQAAAAALPALAQGAARGKLGPETLRRLTDGIASRGRVRVIVGLETTDEPLAQLPGARTRSPAARQGRRTAIARLQSRLLEGPGLGVATPVHRFRDLPFVALEADGATLERLADLPEVASIREDRMLRPTLATSGPQIGTDVARAEGFDGAGKTVVIVDTGLDTSHPAFTGRVVSEACFSTTSATSSSSTLCPSGTNPLGQDSQTGTGAAANCTDMFGCDHGTHVTGIAAGDDPTNTGVAPRADIIPIQVFSRLNDLVACGFLPPCLTSFTSDVVRALEHVYDIRNDFDIAAVNMSLGGEAYATPQDCDAAYPSLKAAVDNLRSAGIATVVASGNEYHLDAIATPACVSSAFSVGAVDGADFVAEFSNSATYLDTLAPGVGIVSTVPGGGVEGKSGTSMAAPQVAGAVTTLAAAAPAATADELFAALLATGVPVTDWRNGLITPRVQVDEAAFQLTANDLDRLRIGLESIASGLSSPSWIGHAGDGSGRLFVAERGGRIRVHDGATLLAAPYLDLSTRVACCTRDGLTGVAFHPGYPANGRLFVAYVDPADQLVVEEYAAAPGGASADPSSATEVIALTLPPGGHAGGSIAFGPDGHLYLTVGDGAVDGAPAATAGDPSSLLGKVLRLDVDGAAPYSIPPDNPFVGVAGAHPEIWALGLRQPRQVAFDSASGALYLTDEGESGHEEVEHESAASPGGADYGWDVMEGDACRFDPACDASGFTAPVASYPHGADCAIAGGAVYRGASYPGLQGAYLFGDRCSGLVRALRNDGVEWRQAQMMVTPLAFAVLGPDQAGEVYAADTTSGVLYRVVPSDLAITTTSLPRVNVGEPFTATLQASGGTGPFTWSDAGTLPAGVSLDPATGVLSGVALEPSSGLVTIRVADATFASAQRRLRLTVVPPPLVIVTTALPEGIIDQPYAAALEAYGGTPPYTWSLASGSLPTGVTIGADGTLAGAPTVGGRFTPTLAVTDSTGKQSSGAFTFDVLGPEVALLIGVADQGAYGQGFGTNAHEIGLVASFAGGTSDLHLHVTGYDIDFGDEVQVLLNDAPLGYLVKGPNNGLTAGNSLLLPLASQVPGENTVRFAQRVPGWIWGVTGLLVSTEASAVSVATTAIPDALAGAAYVVDLAAAGGLAPYAWRVSAGTLPPGITLDATGRLSGTPSEQGVFPVTVEVTDGQGLTAQAALSLAVVGASGTIEVALALGFTDPGEYGYGYGTNEHRDALHVTFDGTLTDLTLSVIGFDIDHADEVSVWLNGTRIGYLAVGPNNVVNAGQVIVVPGALQVAGRNEIEFRQRVSGWTWGVTGLLLDAGPLPLAVVTDTLPGGTVGSTYQASLVATGGVAPYQWSVTGGSLAPGVTLAGDGTLGGLPTAQGTYAFTVQATDANLVTASRALSIDVVGASGGIEIPLTLGVQDTGAYGKGYGSNEHEVELVATFDSVGTDLALWVTGYDIDKADEIAVFLNGAPIGYLTPGPNNGLNAGDRFDLLAAAQLPGRNEIAFRQRVTGWVWGVTGLLVDDGAPRLAIETQTLPDATDGQPYAIALAATGGAPPYQWRLAAGGLPPGLSLDASGSLSGTVAGQGAYALTVELTDADGTVETQALQLLSLAADGTLGVTLVHGITQDGEYGHNYGTNRNRLELKAWFESTGGDIALQVTGFDIDFVDEVALELNGVAIGYLSPGANAGTNAGDLFIFPAGQLLPGTNEITFRQGTSGWMWGVTALLITDAANTGSPLVLNGDDPPDGTFGQPYLASLQAAGGLAPYSWAISAGALPRGLALDQSGTISGTADGHGIHEFTVQVTDAAVESLAVPFGVTVYDVDGTLAVTLETGGTNPGVYGYRYGSGVNRDELAIHFDGEAVDLTLSLTGYDIDAGDEISVELNGAPIGFLSAGPNNGLNAGDAFVLPAAAQLPGENTVVLRQRVSGWIWGVLDLALSP